MTGRLAAGGVVLTESGDFEGRRIDAGLAGVDGFPADRRIGDRHAVGQD